MRLLFDHPCAVCDWVGQKLGKPIDVAHAAFGCIDREGTLRGGFVFTNYTGTSVELSLAGRGCFERGVWAAVIDYAFRQLGCARLQIHTMKTNKFVRRWAPKAGLHFEGVARRLYGRVDGLCYSLTVDDLPAFKARWGIR